MKLLTQIKASDNQPLVIKKNRYNPEEKKYSSNIYILPHLEETINYVISNYGHIVTEVWSYSY